MSGLHIPNGWNGDLIVAANGPATLALTVSVGHEADGRATVTVTLDAGQAMALSAALTHLVAAQAQRGDLLPRATEMGAMA